MKATLRSVEIGKDRPLELPDDVVAVRLEPVIERAGGVIPVTSSERFILYYLERES